MLAQANKGQLVHLEKNTWEKNDTLCSPIVKFIEFYNASRDKPRDESSSVLMTAKRQEIKCKRRETLAKQGTIHHLEIDENLPQSCWCWLWFFVKAKSAEMFLSLAVYDGNFYQTFPFKLMAWRVVAKPR